MAPRKKKQVRESIAANVANTRKRARMTQATLAERSHVDVRTIQDLEGAVYDIKAYTLLAVADSLGKPIDSLVRPAKMKPRKRGRPRKA